MPRWTDVRVRDDQLHDAVRAIVDAYQPVSFYIDHHPPASGPEVAITVEAHTEAAVIGVLARASVDVLASRSRLGESLKDAMPGRCEAGGWAVA